MGIKKKSTLQKLYTDKKSGSTDILQELHEHLSKEQKMLEVFPNVINEIKDQFKTFQSVQSYLDELEDSLNKGKSLDDFFEKYDDLLGNMYEMIFRRAKPILSKYKKIITLSNSKTVLEILKLLKTIQPKLEVTVCESRPKLEGKVMAKKLADSGIKVQLIIDADMPSAVKKCGAALIGTDTILEYGNVINKVGSNNLAILCRYYSVPLFVVADKQKISKKNKFTQKEKPAGEIWQHSISNITIKNFYFEEVHKKLITKIFTS